MRKRAPQYIGSQTVRAVALADAKLHHADAARGAPP
jgi:hypothetical protein